MSDQPSTDFSHRFTSFTKTLQARYLLACHCWVCGLCEFYRGCLGFTQYHQFKAQIFHLVHIYFFLHGHIQICRNWKRTKFSSRKVDRSTNRSRGQPNGRAAASAPFSKLSPPSADGSCGFMYKSDVQRTSSHGGRTVLLKGSVPMVNILPDAPSLRVQHSVRWWIHSSAVRASSHDEHILFGDLLRQVA